MKELPVRRPNRLKGYDYSKNGVYFITICTKNRHEILGKGIVGDAALGVPASVELTEYGETVKGFIENVSIATPEVIVSNYTIMPNHIHLILVMNLPPCGTPRAASPTKALVPKIVNAIKGLSSKEAGYLSYM